MHLRRNLAGRSAALAGVQARVVTTDEENKVLTFRRYVAGRPDEDLLVVLNFSGRQTEDWPVRFPRAGEWSVLLNTDDPRYRREFAAAGATRGRADGRSEAAVTLAPYSAQIFAAGRVQLAAPDMAGLRAAWEAAHGGRLLVEAAAAGVGP